MSNLNDFVIENGVLKNYTGPGGDVVVPEGVVDIAANAFNRLAPGNNVNASIRSIQLPSTLKTIGPNAFCWCEFKRLDIPDGVTKISYKAFNFCDISEITIPDSVFDIGSEALKDTTWMRAHRDSLVVYAGKVLLEYRDNQTEVLIDPGTIGIAGDAFSGCKGLKTVVIPETVRLIGNRAFSKCSSLESVTILGQPEIGKECFPEGTAVFAPKLPLDKVKGAALKKQLFLGALLHQSGSQKADKAIQKYFDKNFADITSEMQTRAGLLEGAVAGKLISKEQAEHLLERYSGDASKCAVLLTYQKNNGFILQQDISLASFQEPTAADLKAIWKTTTRPDKTLELSIYKGTDIHVQVPGTVGKKPVTKIGSCCFDVQNLMNKNKYVQNHLPIRAVELPEGITELGGAAFRGCVNLKTVGLPSTLITIGDCAFYECTAITGMVVPPNAKSIGYAAFYNCSQLIEIHLPDSLECIGDYAFWGCTELRQIRLPAAITALGKDLFHDCKHLTIYGQADSAAEQYAKEYNISFVAEE